MKILLSVLTLLFSHLATSETDLTGLFKKVMTAPSESTLSEFSKACTPATSLSFESSSKSERDELIALANAGLKSKSIFAIRALVKSVDCTGQGASTEWVTSFLGNEVLHADPQNLVDAIHLEKKEKELGSVSNRESNEWFAVECAPKNIKCYLDFKSYWQKKYIRLNALPNNKSSEPVRKSLLQAVETNVQKYSKFDNVKLYCINSLNDCYEDVKTLPLAKNFPKSAYTILGFELEKAELKDILTKFKVGKVIHTGEAGSSLYRLCYQDKNSQFLSFESDEMGSGTTVMTVQIAKNSHVAKELGECTKVDTFLGVAATESGLKLGLTVSQVQKLLGPPSKKEKDLLIYSFSRDFNSKKSNQYTEAVSFVFRFTDGKVDSMSVGKLTSS